MRHAPKTRSIWPVVIPLVAVTEGDIRDSSACQAARVRQTNKGIDAVTTSEKLPIVECSKSRCPEHVQHRLLMLHAKVAPSSAAFSDSDASVSSLARTGESGESACC